MYFLVHMYIAMCSVSTTEAYHSTLSKHKAYKPLTQQGAWSGMIPGHGWTFS